MPDPGPRIANAMVGAITSFCRTFAPLGLIALVVWDVTMLGMGGDPFAAPLHGLAIALIVIIFCVALADWNRRHNDARFDALERRLVAVALESPTVPLPRPRAVVGLAHVVEPYSAPAEVLPPDNVLAFELGRKLERERRRRPRD